MYEQDDSSPTPWWEYERPMPTREEARRATAKRLRDENEMLRAQRAALEQLVAAFVIYTRHRDALLTYHEERYDDLFLQAHGLGA